MSEPRGESGGPRYEACPFCTIQIEAGVPVCPHCRQPLPDAGPGGKGARGRVVFPSASRRPERPGPRRAVWLRIALPVAALAAVALVAFLTVAGPKVRVEIHPSLPLRAETEVRGERLAVRGTVTNRGEDVTDLSLRSIGVVAEFVYRDGRREKRTVFPKAPYRGEGALLNGEEGVFEVETSRKGLSEVILRAEIVDLGMGQTLIPPGGARRVLPGN